MSEREDDPLLGLLTDIAEGVAALTARVDAMEAEGAAHRAQVNEALGTIAEIATRTYYASKPTSSLPDDVVNAPVMNPMIERWRPEWVMTLGPSEFKIFNNLDALSTEEIEALLRERAVVAKKATNAERIRHKRKLALLKDEMDKRFKAHQKSIERDAPGRSR
jgi:hypothetical protein